MNVSPDPHINALKVHID